jgi:hypothetical protein
LVQVELGMEFGTVLGMSLDSELDTVPSAPLRSKIGSELGETLRSKLGIELEWIWVPNSVHCLDQGYEQSMRSVWTYTRCATIPRAENRKGVVLVASRHRVVYAVFCACDE